MLPKARTWENNINFSIAEGSRIYKTLAEENAQLFLNVSLIIDHDNIYLSIWMYLV